MDPDPESRFHFDSLLYRIAVPSRCEIMVVRVAHGDVIDN